MSFTAAEAAEQTRKRNGTQKSEGTPVGSVGTTVARTTADAATQTAGKVASSYNPVGVPSKPDPHAAAGVIKNT